MKKAASDYLISIALDNAIQGILDNLPFKITLFALYGIVWIWGLAGEFSYFQKHYLNNKIKSYTHFSWFKDIN